MKYVGSKARVAKYICPILNSFITENGIKTYIEPFVGGGNVIQHIQCQNKIGIDNNTYLIALWRALQCGWNPNEIKMTKALYDDIKANMQNYPPEVVGLTGFCATYNAKWFGGYAGVVHTKVGTERNYYAEAVRNMMRQVDSIQDVQFEVGDFFSLNSHGTLILLRPAILRYDRLSQ